MKAIAITNRGIERVCEKEIKELINPKKTGIEDSVVVFEPGDPIDLCTLCYKAQSVIKIILLKQKLEFKEIEDIGKSASKIDFSDFIKGKRFRVKCFRQGEHDFSSTEVEQEIGENIKGEVDLKNPEVIIYAYVLNNACYMGVDFAGFDLSKRQYRIFTYRETLRATIAYALLRIADYTPKKYLLDPFCSSGTIPIEAALFATGFPVNYFSKDKFSFLNFDCFKDIDFEELFGKIDSRIDQNKEIEIRGFDSLLGYVKASQKNAKIAGINKSIRVTRADIDWLDTKIDKEKVDCIITHPMQITERNRKTAENIYHELFHQAEFILKKNGIMVIACESNESAEIIRRYAKEYKFKAKKDIPMMQGKMELKVLVLSR